MVVNLQCVQFIFHSLPSLKKQGMCEGASKNSQIPRILPRETAPPVLKILDPPLENSLVCPCASVF